MLWTMMAFHEKEGRERDDASQTAILSAVSALQYATGTVWAGEALISLLQ